MDYVLRPSLLGSGIDTEFVHCWERDGSHALNGCNLKVMNLVSKWNFEARCAAKAQQNYTPQWLGTQKKLGVCPGIIFPFF